MDQGYEIRDLLTKKTEHPVDGENWINKDIDQLMAYFTKMDRSKPKEVRILGKEPIY